MFPWRRALTSAVIKLFFFFSFLLPGLQAGAGKLTVGDGETSQEADGNAGCYTGATWTGHGKSTLTFWDCGDIEPEDLWLRNEAKVVVRTDVHPH